MGSEQNSDPGHLVGFVEEAASPTGKDSVRAGRGRERQGACHAAPCGFKLFCLTAEILNTDRGKIPAVDAHSEGSGCLEVAPPR